MASVSFKITTLQKVNNGLVGLQDGQIIFARDTSAGSESGKIFVDYSENNEVKRRCYTPEGTSGQPVQTHDTFLGISSVEPVNGQNPVVQNSEITNPNAGEWVAVQDSGKEYYWDGSEWKPFGDETASGGSIDWDEDEDAE